MSEDIDVNILFKAVDQMSSGINNMKGSIDGLTDKVASATKQTSMFKDALSMASGMLIRDFTRGVTSSITSGMELGAQMQSLSSSFDAMTQKLGATDLNIEKLRKATKGTVSDVKLLRAANQAMALGLPVDKIDELFGSAMKLGRAMGIDTLSAVESLTTGIGRQSNLILDNLGITFRAETAYEWYAAQLGVTTSELDDNQKKLAWQSYAMQEVTRRAEDLGDIQDDMITQQEQWAAKQENLNTQIGQALSPLGGFKGLLDGVAPIIGTIAAKFLPDLITKIAGKTGLTAAFTSLKVSIAGVNGELLTLKSFAGLTISIAVVIAVAWAAKEFLEQKFPREKPPETLTPEERAIWLGMPTGEARMGVSLADKINDAIDQIRKFFEGLGRTEFRGFGQYGIARAHEGLYYLHEGETVLPPSKTLTAPANVTIYQTNTIGSISSDVDAERFLDEIARREAKLINEKMRAR